MQGGDGSLLPAYFSGDLFIVFLSLLISSHVLPISTISIFFWLLVLAAAKFAWNWVMCIPAYVTFRASTATHWTIDAFWILRLVELPAWAISFLSSLLKLRLADLLPIAASAAVSVFISWHTLRILKRAAEDKFSRRRIPLL
jgi:hypothetical protein